MSTRLFPTTAPFCFGANRFDIVTERTGSGMVRGDGAASLRRAIRDKAPKLPGVYAMLDADGALLYLGKAKQLRHRLLNYFRKSSPEQKKARRLIRRTALIRWEVAPNEFAALLRELELIRRERPRFNVMGQPRLKNRIFVCLGKTPAPHVLVTRNPPRNCHAIFGPIPFSPKAKVAARFLNDHFRLRDCPKNQTVSYSDQTKMFVDHGAAGCLRFELNTCLGPCIAACSSRKYLIAVNEAKRFLLGKNEILLSMLKTEMDTASKSLHFEKAGTLRDAIESITWLNQALKRLREARQQLTFLYPVQSTTSKGQLWYWIHQGQCLGLYPEPSTKAEHNQLMIRLRKHVRKNPVSEMSLEEVDHVWLMSAWFRKFPKEMKRTLSIQQV